MCYRRGFAVSVVVVCCLAAAGKDRKKDLLSADVLRAETVLVMVDPDAGVDAQDPNANRAARENVENALVKWGRLKPVAETPADLIIVVRKGNGRIAQPTIGGTPTNGMPPLGQSGPTTEIGGRGANVPCDASDPACGAPSNGGPISSGPHPQMDVAPTKDTFAVYRGGGSDPLDAPAVWRYSAKNALDAPDVPAVEAFEKLVAESDKQLAKKP